eukprot:gnl/MRDRNA2_/MRDRNA2_15419_c0_seq1.p1 gnl/MRDRNA2_/MRDRNA2_15419_c0~~gnl/MRDRNA2_/MRDRNA2_15419_c0_seq1.p1  ORF type:complete len:107 (+),score=25.45 gnl/MRDRNA2_/MRDRNA2_15419_c0_seq1:40-360(+)
MTKKVAAFACGRRGDFMGSLAFGSHWWDMQSMQDIEMATVKEAQRWFSSRWYMNQMCLSVLEKEFERQIATLLPRLPQNLMGLLCRPEAMLTAGDAAAAVYELWEV